MADSTEKERRKAGRLALLERMYDAAGADVRVFVSAFELSESLGLDATETTRVLAYLEEKGYVKVDDYQAAIARLTAAGIDAVES